MPLILLLAWPSPMLLVTPRPPSFGAQPVSVPIEHSAGPQDSKPADIEFQRLPPPSEAEQTAMLDRLRASHAAAYVDDSPAGQIALADALYEQSKGLFRDPTGRFVCLIESYRLSLEAKDLERTLRAIEETEALFAWNGVEPRVRAIKAVARRAPDERVEALTRQALRSAGELISREDFDGAGEVLRSIKPLIRKAGAEMEARFDSAQWFVDEGERAESASRKLRTAPNSVTPKRTLGRYRCLVLGNFELGLPILRESFRTSSRRLTRDEEWLERAVEADRAADAGLEQRVAAGDAWLAVARVVRWEERHGAVERTLHWYEQVLPAWAGTVRGEDLRTRAEEAAALLEFVWEEAPATPGSGGRDVRIVRVGLDTGKDSVIVYYARDEKGREIEHERRLAPGPGDGRNGPDSANWWRDLVREQLPDGCRFARSVEINVTRPSHKPDHGEGKRCSWTCLLEKRGRGKVDDVCTTNEVRGKQ